MEQTQEKQAYNNPIIKEKGQRHSISFGNKELFEDFMGDYIMDLKKEFLQGRSADLLNDYDIEIAFDDFCKGQFNEWLDDVRYKYV